MSARTLLPSGLVTFLFTDIEGSTRLALRLGAGYQPVLRTHRQLLRRIVRAGGGVEMFTEGDSFFFAFADAGAALTVCRRAQQALARHDWPDPRAKPRVRMGLHTGWVRPRNGEYASPEVHRAARIAAAAHGGQVLCSAATAAHGDRLPTDTRLRDLGLYRLRGFEGRERLYQLVAPDLLQRFPHPRTAPAAPHNLPAYLASFVGRERELQRLGDLLADHRLVTVVGPGGAGKTRLAVQVAAAQVTDYPDGVWFVDLSTAAGTGVAATVAAVLGLSPEPGHTVLDALADHVAGRRMLLLLDTCDAGVESAARAVARLLATGEAPTVLATSREPLGLPGEVAWRPPPLSMEPADDGAACEAVLLLADRAAAARGGSALDTADLRHLVRIAQRLDGSPLALEMAAARLRVLSPAQLADRLHEDECDLLETLDAGRAGAGGRQATWEANLKWSYRTLGPETARLLRWLSVFPGPVDLATAGWVCGGDPLEALTVLVDKSLLQVDQAGRNPPEPAARATPADHVSYRYRMPDLVRAYAHRALAERGEEPAARRRHLTWSLEALGRAGLGPDGRPVTLSLHRLDPVAPQVRAALRWCAAAGPGDQGLRLICGLDQWWSERGPAGEARAWLSRLYRRIGATGERVDDGVLATAYHVHAGQACADGEHAEQLRYIDEAEAAARRVGDPRLLTRVRAGRGISLWELGREAEAERVCREVIARAAAEGVPPDALSAVYCLARLLWQRGALDEAAELLGRGRQAESARPDVRGRRTADMLLGMVALARGDLVAAHDHLVVALRSRMTFGYHLRACDTLGAMAVRCAAGGDPVTAARLFGAVQSARARQRPASVDGAASRLRAAHEAAVRDALGDAAFDRWYAQGAALDLAEAAEVAFAVDQEARSSTEDLTGTDIAATALAPRLTGEAGQPSSVHRVGSGSPPPGLDNGDREE